MRNSRFQEESLFLFSETSCWMRAYYFPSLYFYILLLYSWNSRSHAEELFCCSLKQFLNNKHNTCLQQYLFITFCNNQFSVSKTNHASCVYKDVGEHATNSFLNNHIILWMIISRLTIIWQLVNRKLIWKQNWWLIYMLLCYD